VRPTHTLARWAGRARASHPIVWFLAKRLATMVGLVWVVSVVVFLALQVLPGDAAAAILGRQATPEALAALRQELGLDESLWARYWDWVSGLLTGDLGTAYSSQLPVSEVIGDRLVNTLTLALVATAVMVPLSLLLGVLAGIRAGRAADGWISASTLAFIAVPDFIVGTLLSLLFGVTLTLLPPVSLVAPGVNPLQTPDVLVLPVATLTLVGSAYMIRMVRAGVVEALASDYVQMARLNGMPERRVVVRYALRNALAPAVNVIALTLQWLVGGVAITEVVFSYPGIGLLLVEAVQTRDLPLVQTLAMLVAVLYILINLVADLVVVLLIPKLRTAQLSRRAGAREAV
jgi:peptide/nickel transport system permease protein